MPSNTSETWPDWLAAHVPKTHRTEFLAEVTQAIQRKSQVSLSELTHLGVSSAAIPDRYLQRVLNCVWHHWERFTETLTQLPSVSSVLGRLERGDLGYKRPQSNVLRDVIMAQALEEHEVRAVSQFDIEFMPGIRRIAQRTAGERGLDLVENFVADLLLPRETRSPRISGYLGKTSLSSWLRVVVVNHCLEAGRKVASAYDITELEVPAPPPRDPESNTGECENLLQPIFARAVGGLDPDDRLLIKLLVIDEVPQHALASKLNIHSGNVTRRRQKISQQIWLRLNELSQSCGNAPHRVSECLELVLAGDDVEMRRSLGGVLANAVAAQEVTP